MKAVFDPGAKGPAYAALALAVLVGGANWPIMKIGIGDIPPVTFAFLRVAIAWVTLTALVAATGGLRVPPRKDWGLVLGVGVFQMTFFLTLIHVGLASVPAGRSAVLAYTAPLWVTPAAILLLGERPGPLKLTGVAVGLLAIGVLFNPLAIDWSNAASVRGNAWLMLAALFWAGALLVVRARPTTTSTLALVPWQTGLAGVLIGLWALIADAGKPVTITPQGLGILAYNGMIATAFFFWATVFVIRRLSAVTASLSFLAIPVAGITASALMLGERADVSLLAGVVLTMVAVALVSLSRERPPARGAREDASAG